MEGAPSNPYETLSREVSLQALDPSPVDDSPVELSETDPFVENEETRNSHSSQSKNSASLGLSGHSTIWWLQQTQRYSSYLFTTFTAMHITNTSIIPLITKSVPSSDKYLLLTRPFYQSPIFEIGLVLGPIVAHVASGIGLRFYRRNQNIKWYGAESKEDRQKVSWPKLSATSILGYTLWPIAFLHVVVNRYVPLFVDGGSSGVGLGYVAHGCAKYSKVMSIFYGSLVLVGVSHFVRGWAKWLNLEPNQTTGGGDAVDKGLRKKRRWYIMNGLAVGITALWMVGGGVVAGGGASTGWIGEGFDKLYRSVPIIGNWY